MPGLNARFDPSGDALNAQLYFNLNFLTSQYKLNLNRGGLEPLTYTNKEHKVLIKWIEGMNRRCLFTMTYFDKLLNPLYIILIILTIMQPEKLNTLQERRGIDAII
jgi:hypothetical protein